MPQTQKSSKPATKSNFDTFTARHRKLARDCGARMISTCFRLAKTSRLYDRANENDTRANTCARLPSRTPQSDHPGSQIPPARQREHAAFQNTVLRLPGACAAKPHVDLAKLQFKIPHRANENSPMKTALADPSETRFHDESQWHTLSASPRTVADGCGRLRTLEQLLANTASTRRPPLINGSPSPHIREKEGAKTRRDTFEAYTKNEGPNLLLKKEGAKRGRGRKQMARNRRAPSKLQTSPNQSEGG